MPLIKVISLRRLLYSSLLFYSVFAYSQILREDHPSQNSNLNPRTLAYVLPSDLHWTEKSEGLEIAIVSGDPSKAGPYILFARWSPNHMSRPHFHPNDRFVTVISGTWWVGTGDTFSPETAVPMHAGTFITHFAKQVHYDGAKDDGCVLEIVGEGPAPSIPAEKK